MSLIFIPPPTTFLVFSDLDQPDQNEVLRIQAIPEEQRNDNEVAFLAARADYLDNRILEKDVDGNILRATGLAVPGDTTPGFAKGATFIERDTIDGSNAMYENLGTSESSQFSPISAAA